MKKFAADINLYLYVGRGFIRNTIQLYIESFGEGYNEDLAANIENEVLANSDILEAQLIEEWADYAAVEFDESDQVNGSVEYEGEENPLDFEEIRDLERVVEDFIYPFVEEAIDAAEQTDLIWIPVSGSSNVGQFAYDPTNRFMYVEFLDKGQGAPLYQYDDVDPATYNAFLAAPSKGKAVWQLLRDRFDYHRLR